MARLEQGFGLQVAAPSEGPKDPRDQRIRELERQADRLRSENESLRRKAIELERKAARLEKENDSLKASLVKLPMGGLAVYQAEKASPARRSPACPSERSVVMDTATSKRRRRQGHFRPRPVRVDREVVVPLRACPDCHGSVTQTKRHEHLVQEIVRPVVETTRYRTYSGWCTRCVKRVASKAPEQLSSAAGAAGVSLGATTLSMAAMLKYDYAMPFAKVAALFSYWGLRVTSGGLSHAMDRMHWRLAAFQQAAKKAVRRGRSIWGDETGWYIRNKKAWLWDFVTEHAAYVAIRRSRGSDVVREVLGDRVEGTLHCDFWSPYEAVDCPKQRCVAHLLRELHKWAASYRRPPPSYLKFHDRVCPLFKEALAIKKSAEAEHWSYLRRERAVEQLRARMLRILGRSGKYWSPDAERLANRMWLYRDQLFGFIVQSDAEATNNRVERAIRPLVIGRKIGGGCRSDRGARTYSAFATLVQTCRIRGLDFVQTCRELWLAAVNHTPHPLIAQLRAAS